MGPLLVSLKVMFMSALLLLAVGLPLAWALSRPAWYGRRLLELLVSLPLVFPPVALGFFLLLVLGRQGWLNTWLPEYLRIDVIFSFPALLIAAVVAGLPLLVKPLQAALQQEIQPLIDAAQTLGKTGWEIFLHVTLPSIAGVLGAGLALSVGRGMGEVGMSLLLGGNLVGKTDTLSLALYNAVLDGDFSCARNYALIMALLALVLFSVLDRLSGRPGRK